MSRAGRDLEIRIAPAAGATVPAGLGPVLAEAEYDRVLPPAAGRDDASSTTETVRFGLAPGLIGATVLEDWRPDSELSLRVLRGNGVPAISRVERPDGGRLATFRLSAAEITLIAAPLPRPAPETPLVERSAQLVASDGPPLRFERCTVQVSPVTVAGGRWRALGLEALFHVERPATITVNLPVGDALEIGVAWQGVHLGVDGRFSAHFPHGAGDAWLWRLVGARRAIGVVLDDLTGPRRSTIAIALPPVFGPIVAPGGAEAEGCGRPVPAVASEQELADNPHVYSEDAGAYCRPFSNPERVLGERAFNVIVRVEQPAISGAPSIKTGGPTLLDFDIPAVALQPRLGGGTRVPSPPRSSSRRPRGAVAPGAEPVSAATGWAALLADNTSILEANLPPKYTDYLSGLPRGRTELDAEHPIQWEGDPARYQAATVARGHILEYRVRWRSNGYSLGNVASTLTLAPRQVKRIQKVEWQRSERARRDERTAFAERVADEVLRDRTYEDVIQASLSEWSRGGSESSASSGGGGFGFAALGFVIGGGGTSTNASSSSFQEGGRRASASEDQRLRDSIRRFADALRRFESTVVTEVTQEENVTGTVEVVRNPNYGRSLTVIYHQILRHLRVDTEVAGVRECLFVPFAMRPFTLERAYRWRETLESYLRDQRYAPALRYMKDVLSAFVNSAIPPGRRSDLPVRHVFGSIYLTLGVERPKDGAEGAFDEAAWARLSRFLGVPARGVFGRLKEIVEQQRDRVFQEQYAPRIAARWVDTLELEVDGQALEADFTLATRYQFGGVARVDFTAPIPDGQTVTRETLRSVAVKASAALAPGSTAGVTRLNFTYQTDHFERSVGASQGVGDLIVPDTGEPDAGATISTLPSSWERQDLRAEIVAAVSDLLRHLNEHLEFYNKAVLWTMDRDRLLILLDGFYVPRTAGVSIASVVERDPVAIVGNCLVFRVSAGSFLGLDDIKTPRELLDFYLGAEAPRAPMLVSLPTDGLYAQAIMDPCDALEQHFGNTDWVLTDKEPELGDLPPELLQSRGAPAAGTTPTPLPATIINLQNAPEAPAPSGLQGILGAVSNANAFRDMAGLAGTQANARAAMETAAGLATNFGNQAAALKLADIAAKAQATQTVDQQLASIQRAKELGLVSAEEAALRASDVLKGLHSPSASTPPHENPAMTRAIQAAGRTSGSVIEATTQDGQVRVEMGKGQDVGSPDAGAEPAEETPAEEEPEEVRGLWFDDHGSEFGTDPNFDPRDKTNIQVAFNEDEHFDLGTKVQWMTDVWAVQGLIEGGAIIDTKAFGTQTGLSAPISDWDIFTPDPADPMNPYRGPATEGRGHWHYVTPDPLYSDRANGVRWTPDTLRDALRQGKAAALSLGQIIMMAGDQLGSFDELKDPAAQPRWTSGGPVHVMDGFAQKDPLAYTLFKIELFPPTKLATLNMLERARDEAAAVKQEIADGRWKDVEGVVAYLQAARGTTPFTELHLLAHTLFSPSPLPGGNFDLNLIAQHAPWMPASALQQLKDSMPIAVFDGVKRDGIPERFYKIVVSNGQYAGLAIKNAHHFAPTNWIRFNREQRAALELVEKHLASPPSGATAPIPAEALARTAFALHFLTDAFSAGHMRVPRVTMDVAGAMAAKLMHDLDGKYGLQVKNDFGDVWRAFGDGYLNPTHRPKIQTDMLKDLAQATTPVDADGEANHNRALAAVGSALKQLHYEAQRHFDDAAAAQFKPVLDAVRLEGRLAGDVLSPGMPGDGGFDDWLQLDVQQKLNYMDRHRPQPLLWGPSLLENHPPLYDVVGNVAKEGYSWREDDVTSLGKNKILRLKWHRQRLEFDFSDLYHFGSITQGMGGWVAGGETWIQQLLKQLNEDV